MFSGNYGTPLLKLLLTCLFFNISTNLYALELKEVKAFLSDDIKYIEKDQSAKVKGGYSYKAKYEYHKRGKSVEIKEVSKPKTIENLLSSLFYAYQKKDIDLMKKHFTKEGRAALDALPKDKIQKQFFTLSNLKDPKLEYVLKYKKGFFVSWFDQSFLGKRKLYIIQEKKVFKVAPMHDKKGEGFTHNMNIYILKNPFETFEPTMVERFSKIKNGESKTISFSLKTKGNMIHMFKKGEKKVRLMLSDNVVFKDAPLADLSNKDAFIEVKLTGENFKEYGKQDIYFIESNYPMEYIDKRHLSKAKKFTVEKVE